MDNESETPQPKSAARPATINFAGLFAALLANAEVRAWLHHLLDTALDNVPKATRGPDGTVIWGSNPTP